MPWQINLGAELQAKIRSSHYKNNMIAALKVLSERIRQAKDPRNIPSFGISNAYNCPAYICQGCVFLCSIDEENRTILLEDISY